MFRSEFFIRTTQELEYLFFLSRKARNFLPECNIRLYDKNSESDYFFFLHQNQNIFFNNIGNQNIFLEKNQVKWSFPKLLILNSSTCFLHIVLLEISHILQVSVFKNCTSIFVLHYVILSNSLYWR